MQHLRIASTAPAGFRASRQLSSRKAVSQVAVHSPRRVVTAGEGTAAVASTDSVGVRERVVVLITSQNRSTDRSLAAPGARRLAAIPVSRRVTTAGGSVNGERASQGEVKSGRSHGFGG
jgi:hypothetical protein